MYRLTQRLDFSVQTIVFTPSLLYSFYLIQLTTPSEPAMAVSTAINTLSNLPQSMETHPIPPSREGAAKPPDLVFVSSIVVSG